MDKRGTKKIYITFVLATLDQDLCCWDIGLVLVVIEIVVVKQDDREVHKVDTEEWRKAKSAETGIYICFSSKTQ